MAGPMASAPAAPGLRPQGWPDRPQPRVRVVQKAWANHTVPGNTASGPMSTLPRNPKDESVIEFLYRSNLKDFQQKAIGYSVATLATLGLYLAFRHDVPLKAAWVLI